MTCAVVFAFNAVSGIAGRVDAAPRGIQPPRTIVAPSTAARAVSGAGIGRPDPAQCRVRDTLTYHGGKLISHPDIFILFWGPLWNSDPEHIAAKAKLIALYQSIGSSEYACAWREYAVAGHPLGAGTYNGSFVIGTTPSNPLADASLQAEIDHQIALGNAPPRSDDRFYAVATQKGIVIDGGDGTTGCGGSHFVFCGYHSSFGTSSAPFRYTALPFPCTQGGGTCFEDPTDDAGLALQHVASHELAEAVTDPDFGSTGAAGWYSDRTGSENADICSSYACDDQLTVGADTFLVNPNWSNLGKGCVTSVPCNPTPACTDDAPGVCTPSTSRTNACAFEWQVDPNLTQKRNLPTGKITCSDGQSFCDFDGANDGRCTFHVAACLNSTDPRPAVCSPLAVDAIQLAKPRADSLDPVDAANSTSLLSALAAVDGGSTGTTSGSTVSYAPAATTANACTTFVDVVVPLGSRNFALAVQGEGAKVAAKLKLTCRP